MTYFASRDGLSVGGLIKLMCALFLAGVAMRMTILAMPPVIPLVRSCKRFAIISRNTGATNVHH